MNKLKTDFDSILSKTIESVKPESLFKNKISRNKSLITICGKTFLLDAYESIYVVGAGKAAAAMAVETEKIIFDEIKSGIVVTKYGHLLPTQKIKVLEAGHPIPDENSLNAAKKITNLLKEVKHKDLVIFLISGGASALLEKLPEEIDLESLRKTNQLLIDCGASIEEINIIRKQISLIKGGKILKKIPGAEVISIIISDVIGDSLSTIASGLTAPDYSNFSDAIKLVNKYCLTEKLPYNVNNHLLNGYNKEELSSSITVQFPFERVHNFIIGTNKDALNRAEIEASNLGYSVIKFPCAIRGEARETAKLLVEYLHKSLNTTDVFFPICFLAGGETTVTVKGNGKGGRNQELTLALLPLLEKSEYKFLIGSIGTDGSDGETNAAGAYIDNDTLISMRKHNLNPKTFLNRNDSYNFFTKTGGLIKTGPTYTNVMDIFIGLVDL